MKKLARTLLIRLDIWRLNRQLDQLERTINELRSN